MNPRRASTRRLRAHTGDVSADSANAQLATRSDRDGALPPPCAWRCAKAATPLATQVQGVALTPAQVAAREQIVFRDTHPLPITLGTMPACLPARRSSSMLFAGVCRVLYILRAAESSGKGRRQVFCISRFHDQRCMRVLPRCRWVRPRMLGCAAVDYLARRVRDVLHGVFSAVVRVFDLFGLSITPLGSPPPQHRQSSRHIPRIHGVRGLLFCAPSIACRRRWRRLAGSATTCAASACLS